MSVAEVAYVRSPRPAPVEFLVLHSANIQHPLRLTVLLKPVLPVIVVVAVAAPTIVPAIRTVAAIAAPAAIAASAGWTTAGAPSGLSLALRRAAVPFPYKVC